MRNVTVNSIGEYIREQREQAKISMRQLAQSAGVSNPYLSQIERGLRKPSADILQQIAKGLRISAEALYVQAGILEDRPADSGVRSALLADPELSERQKQVLIEIYESFRRENATTTEATADADDRFGSRGRTGRTGRGTGRGSGRAGSRRHGSSSGHGSRSSSRSSRSRSGKSRSREDPNQTKQCLRLGSVILCLVPRTHR